MDSGPPTRLRPRSLRTPLLWAVGGLVAALALLLSLAFAAILKERLTEQAGSALQALARNGAQSLADDLFERSQLVQVLAQSPDLWRDGLDAPAVHALIARIPLIRPYCLWMGVANAKGQVVQSSGGLLQGRSVADMPWFAAGSQASTVSDVLPAKLLAPLLPSGATGEAPQLVSFSAPIRDHDVLLGVLSMHTNWDWARETLQALRTTLDPDSQVEFFVFDRHGRLLQAPDGRPNITLAEDLPFPPPSATARLLRWSDSNAAFLTSIAPLPPRNASSDLGWYVVARQPTLQASAMALALLPAVLTAALLAALLTSAALWRLTRSTVRELGQMAQAAQHIGADHPHASLPLLNSSRELQQLSLALHGMHQQQQAEQARAAHEVLSERDRQASTDALTGLLNRRGFSPLLHFAMALARRSGRPLCLMQLDIDNFQLHCADLASEARIGILQDLARHLRARLRDADLVARWSETEFMVLLPDTPAEDVQRMALDILETVAQHTWPAGRALTLSAGMTALHPTLQDGTKDAESILLERCDEALQASRRAGGNQVHFQP